MCEHVSCYLTTPRAQPHTTQLLCEMNKDMAELKVEFTALWQSSQERIANLEAELAQVPRR